MDRRGGGELYRITKEERVDLCKSRKYARKNRIVGGIRLDLTGYAVMAFFKSYLGMEVAASASVAQLAMGFSMFVGIVFGLYPANKASKLKPIDALHYS